MTAISTNAAAEIEEHHRQAQSSASGAINHARAAGSRLLEVKATLPHGQFQEWLTANVTVTARTAQRYMNAAAPKPKCDRLSYSGRRPKVGSKNAKVLTELERVKHREEVLAHANYLVAELPAAGDLRPADIDALRALRDRLDSILS